jgi:hypothetical protein
MILALFGWKLPPLVHKPTANAHILTSGFDDIPVATRDPDAPEHGSLNI